MMYSDGHEVPYYYVIDRMYNVRGIVDYCGSIIERYCYDSYGRPLIRESAGRGDSDNDNDLDSTDPNAVLAGGFDPRMDVYEDGVRNITDWTALNNKRSNWYPATSPTVAQAFSDVDNMYPFQGVPHFAIDTTSNATELVLLLNHHPGCQFARPQSERGRPVRHVRWFFVREGQVMLAHRYGLAFRSRILSLIDSMVPFALATHWGANSAARSRAFTFNSRPRSSKSIETSGLLRASSGVRP